MTNSIFDNTYPFCSEEDEVYQHLPKSFQRMIDIERQAQNRVQKILKDIENGNTTLEEVKKQRGLMQ